MKNAIVFLVLAFSSFNCIVAAAAGPAAVADSAYTSNGKSVGWNYCVNIRGKQVEVFEQSITGIRKLYGPAPVIGLYNDWGGYEILSSDKHFQYYQLRGTGNHTEMTLESSDGSMLVLHDLVKTEKCLAARN